MESVNYNLAEEEFTGSRKILLWIFSGMFFLAGTFILISSYFLGHHESLPPVLATAPYGISLVVAVIAFFATMKRKNHFFKIDDEMIEFRYGLINPKKHTFRWNEISELIMPHKQRKAKVIFKDGSSYTIDLTWLQRKKSSLIRKHIFQAAAHKELKVVKVIYLDRK